jgi:hypothetical protein
MEIGTPEWSKKVLSKVPTMARSRKQDALRRLFSLKPSPETKAAIAKPFRPFSTHSVPTQQAQSHQLAVSYQRITGI